MTKTLYNDERKEIGTVSFGAETVTVTLEGPRGPTNMARDVYDAIAETDDSEACKELRAQLVAQAGLLKEAEARRDEAELRAVACEEERSRARQLYGAECDACDNKTMIERVEKERDDALDRVVELQHNLAQRRKELIARVTEANERAVACEEEMSRARQLYGGVPGDGSEWERQHRADVSLLVRIMRDIADGEYSP